MLSVINNPDRPAENPSLLEDVEQYYLEVRGLLPELPENIELYFCDDFLYDKVGVGGFSYDTGIISLSYDYDFADKALQSKELRGTVFHEAFHQVHGYHDQLPPLQPIEVAVYEGAASVFQRDYAGIERIGRYEAEAEEMMHWAKELQSLDADYDWYKYKVYDATSGRYAISYCVGTFIVDSAILHTDMQIRSLLSKTPKEILKLSKVNLQNN